MRTLVQRRRAERQRVAQQLALAAEQQDLSAHFAHKARLAYERGELRDAEAYQQEAARRFVWAQQHLDRAG